MGAKKKEKGFYHQALDRVVKRLDGSGLPWPRKPVDYASEYEFPADIANLTGGALGKLQGRLAGWEGYTARLLALADVDLELLQASYSIALGQKMAELQANNGKGKLRDILKAEALAAVPELLKATYAIAEKGVLVAALRAQKSIYETQRQALSREQTRRSDEMKARMRSD